MSEHIETRRKLKRITKKSTFNDILEDAMLSDVEKQIMEMHYVQRKEFAIIADELGYSEAGILRKHKHILKVIQGLL